MFLWMSGVENSSNELIQVHAKILNLLSALIWGIFWHFKKKDIWNNFTIFNLPQTQTISLSQY